MEFIDLKAQQTRIRGEIDRRIAAVLDHGQYIMGPEVAELEERLAALVGVKHCIGVANGTDAILIALLALDVKPGDEVITSAFSFIAAAEMIELMGARTVFVDVDPRTYNLDPIALEAAITERTRAIIPVDLYGQCADYGAINDVAARHGIPVIEDAAQSLGATQHGRQAGGLARVATTSFFPSKPLGGYGDGGACFTDDDDLARLMRQIRVHGQDRRYHHPRLGMNGRLDTLQAAILLAKLEVFEEEVARRAEVAAVYDELLVGAFPNRQVAPPILAPGNTSVYAQYTVEVDDRPSVRERLSGDGVPTAVHYPIALSRQPLFNGARQPAACPVSERAAERVMSLPMHPYLERSAQAQVVEALVAALAPR